jgi:hypothetical protein
VMAPTVSAAGIPATRHVSEPLRRAQDAPGRMIYPEAA